MKTVTAFSAVFVFFSSLCLADPFKPAITTDGKEVDIRAGDSIESPIVGKVKAESVFYTVPSDTAGWWRVDAPKGVSGFLSKHKIKLIPTSPEVATHSTSLTPADIEVTAEPTDAHEQYLLGFKHYAGIGIPIDEKKSLYWFGQAAVQGHATAKATLGQQYFAGLGVAKDRKLGLRLIKEALATGDPYAQFYYALCLLEFYDEADTPGAKNRIFDEFRSRIDDVVAKGGVVAVKAQYVRRTAVEVNGRNVRKREAARREAVAGALLDAILGSGGSEEQCSRCAGTGRDMGYGGMSCQYCGGSGRR